MSTISTKQIKEEQKQIMTLSEKKDDVHFTLHINQDCEITQLGFSEGIQFNSVLIIINTLEKTFVKGNIQSIKIGHSNLPFLSSKDDIYISFKTDHQKLNKLYIQINDFQCKATKKGIYFTNDADLITSIYVYLDLNSFETLLIAEPLNLQNLLTISRSHNGTYGSLIKNILLSNSLLTSKQFKSIVLGNSNEK